MIISVASGDIPFIFAVVILRMQSGKSGSTSSPLPALLATPSCKAFYISFTESYLVVYAEALKLPEAFFIAFDRVSENPLALKGLDYTL